jgi:hypothetical protein
MRNSTIHCNNWDSFKPQALTDKHTGQALGTLVPRATQAQLGYGIAPWSKPETETRAEGS